MKTIQTNIQSLRAAQELFSYFLLAGLTPVYITAHGAEPELTVHIDLDIHDRQEVDELIDRILPASLAYRHVDEAEISKIYGTNVMIIHYTFKA